MNIYYTLTDKLGRTRKIKVEDEFEKGIISVDKKILDKYTTTFIIRLLTQAFEIVENKKEWIKKMKKYLDGRKEIIPSYELENSKLLEHDELKDIGKALLKRNFEKINNYSISNIKFLLKSKFEVWLYAINDYINCISNVLLATRLIFKYNLEDEFQKELRNLKIVLKDLLSKFDRDEIIDKLSYKIKNGDETVEMFLKIIDDEKMKKELIIRLI